MHHQLCMKAVAEEYRAGKSELPIVTRLAAKDDANADASVDVSVSAHGGDRLDTPLSSTARAACLHRGHIHCPRATPCCCAHIHPGAATLVPVLHGAPPHRHLRALPVDELHQHTDRPRIAPLLLLQLHTAVAHQQSGLLDRSPARCSLVSSARGQHSLPRRVRAPKEQHHTVVQCSAVRTLLWPPRRQRAVGWHRICGSERREARTHDTPHCATSGGAVRVRDYHPERGQDATHLVACCGERPRRRRCGVDRCEGMHHDGV
jgi:hypothetical protein